MAILMNIYKKLLEYRVYIGIVLLLTTIGLTFTKYDGWWWFALILTIVAIGSHLFFGPIRFIQEAIQAGDTETAEKHLKTVFFPRLLFKPIRQGFYMLKSNLAMGKKDFEGAEKLMNKSIKSSSKIAGAGSEGSSYLQLGMIAMQNRKNNEAKKNFRIALDKGLPDSDSKATAYLQLASLEMNSRRFAQATNLFRKAKQQKPSSAEVKSQIKEMEKHIHRSR